MSDLITGEKNFRRPGDPMRVQICRLDDPEAGFLLRFAQRAGYVPYQHREWTCIDVYGGGLAWASNDASFQPASSGLYRFYKDEKDIWYCEGPK